MHKQVFSFLIPKSNEILALSPYGLLNIKFKQELQDLISLIAYTDPTNCPVSHFLDMKRREWVASKLNSFILAHHDQSTEEASLERILKQLIVTRNILAEESKEKSSKITYPSWSLESF